MAKIFYDFFNSSLGLIGIAINSRGICFLGIGNKPLLETEIHRYFAQAKFKTLEEGIKNKVISYIENPLLKPNLPLDIQGTEFQKEVWQTLTTISPGKTINYSQLAQALKKPKAIRAAARACAANKIAILIPCHRVIRKDGSLGGYRWGISLKKKLLEKEKLLK